MIRRSFFWKLYLSYAVLVLVSAVVIGALVLGNLKKNALHEAETSLFNTARLLAAMEAANPAHLWSDQLTRQIVEVAADTGLHLTLLFANGTTAAESEPSVARTGTANAPATLNLPELRDAREHRFGRDVRSLGGPASEHLLIAVPIHVDYETIGYVRAGLPLARLEARHAELRGRVVAGATLNAIVALGLGFFFARHVTRPLATIGAGCERLAAGHFDERIALRREDEIGVVATTINQMAGEVQRRIYSETRERQRLATLLAVMADGVVAVSARQTIAYLNEVAARILGVDADVADVDATGKRFREHVHQADVVGVYEDARTAGRRMVREVRVTGHPQDQVLRVDATPLTDAGGQPFGVLLVLHDLTEIRRLEDVRRTFAASVSHELKTPLTAIGSLVDTLLDDPDMAPSVRDRFLNKIRLQNQRLHQLVQDILIISRLESERAAIELSPIELDGLVGDCVHTFADIAGQKGMTLSWTPPPAPVVVSGNDEALRLIVNNLLHNAVLYTPAGGAVSVGLASAGGRATLTIRDTGVGIAPEHLERIFERFYRVEQSRARGAGGTGLGLSIVKHLTQALEGRVLVESRPGEGSVFTVQLQLALPADGNVGVPSAAE